MRKRTRNWTLRRVFYGPVSTAAVSDSAPDGEAFYVGTTVGTRHRIVGGALFGRSKCCYWLESGVLTFQRRSGPAITLTGITGVCLSGAHAGQVLAPTRIAVVTWTLGKNQADTGFGFDNPRQAEAFADRVAAAVGLSPDQGPYASA